jgi:hypothetical protein
MSKVSQELSGSSFASLIRKRPFANEAGMLIGYAEDESLFAWISRNRRLAKEVNSTLKLAAAILYAAATILRIHRLAISATFETGS